MEIYRGTVCHTPTPDGLEVLENAYVAVEDGVIVSVRPQLTDEQKELRVTDFGSALIIPAFSDLHVHAPQYPQRGIMMDLLLPDWLSTVTFPQEARFADPEYARINYTAFVEDMLRNGTFHAAVYGTIHRSTVDVLFELMERRGMNGFVGRISMDRNAPDYLRETARESLLEAERYLESHSDSTCVRPILTPRFAPTCSAELLNGLGRLAQKYSCGTQTHLVESRWEAQEALRLFPSCSCDAEIYERAGLLENGPVIFAHTIFPTENDLRIIEKYSAMNVHCPDATNNVIAGIMPAGALLDRGIRVSLGTDVGAGHGMPVYRQVSRAIQLSKLKQFYEPQANRTLSLSEAFYMATAAGGALWGNVGMLKPGYRFDALVIDGMDDAGRELSPAQRLERFCYIGDDRNIKAGYISGRRVT